MAYLIMASSEVDDLPVLVRPAVSSVRAAVIRHFLRGAADDPARTSRRVARLRMADRNVRPSEADWLARKVAEIERTAAAS